jgi:chromate transporter
MSQTLPEWNLDRPVSLSALFIAFLTVSLCGFGGGLVWARRIAVEKRRWISDREFADIVSLCQFMPGRTSSALPSVSGQKCGAP